MDKQVQQSPATPQTQQELDRLLEAVLTSSKYRHVDKDFILFIGASELRKRRNLKEAIKATRKKLHQVGGAYQETTPQYTRWLDELRQSAESRQGERVRMTCRNI